MKKNKFNFDWKSVVLGMVLCMVLVIFVGSNAQVTQVVSKAPTTQIAAQPRVIQGTVTMNALMDKLELMDQRILVLEGKINRLQEGMTDALKTLEMLWNRGERK